MNKSIINSALLFSAVFAQHAIAQVKPNILCVVCEDISPFLGCYGDKVALTPNLDRLQVKVFDFLEYFAPLVDVHLLVLY